MVITDELGGPGFRKPNPKGYDVILREMNVVPSESMYVGDNKEKDFLTPNSIGMLSVLYTGIKGMYNNNKAAPEGGTPQRTIRKLYELKDIIKTN